MIGHLQGGSGHLPAVAGTFFVLLGIALGLLSATLTESLGHKLTGHPGPRQRRLYFRYPELFRPFLQPIFQHLVIHHHKTFQGTQAEAFFQQFPDPQRQLSVDAWIAERFPADFASLIWREKYNLTLRGLSGILPFALPFCAGPLLIALLLGRYAFLGSLLTAFIPVWLSKYIHPLVHLPEQTAQAHPFTRWLMKTNYMRRVLRNHFLHHQEPETNFNLLLGGDYLVGLHRKATAEEEKALIELTREFDRRVDESLKKPGIATSGLNSTTAPARVNQSRAAEGPAPAVDPTPYLALGNPSYEQRFAFQQKLAQAAVVSAGTDLTADYGMSVYDHGLRLETWSQREEFAREGYPSREGRLVYRGIEYEPGDLLLTNQASDSDGLFSTLLEEQINFSHVALFAILPYRGREYPAVIEMNEYGVRAVPLKAFLSKRFNTYVEVFRKRDPWASGAPGRLAAVALEMIDENHAFDIHMDPEQNYYLNCARTVAEIYRRAGDLLIEGQSRYSDRTLPNLQILGIEKSAGMRLLMPDDFIRDPRFGIVGVVENRCFLDLFCRALTRERIQEIWRTEILDPANFPLRYRLNALVVRAIQNATWYSSLCVWLTGLPRAQFPSGPEVFLSLAPIGNQRMEATAQRLRQDLQPELARILAMPSWKALQADPRVRTMVRSASLPYQALYRQPRKRAPLYTAARNASARNAGIPNAGLAGAASISGIQAEI